MIIKDEIPLYQYFDAYFDCRKHKRSTYNSLAFEMNYENNLVELHDDVMMRRYEIGTSITFIVNKPKKREVFAADFRDRVIHHLVIRKLEPLFEAAFINDNYNCRVGKGNLYGLKRLHHRLITTSNFYPDVYVAKFDMQGFFMSISKPLLWNMIRSLVVFHYKGDDKDTILYLLKKIILHCPEKNCIRKSPERLWEDIPANRTLFKNGDDYGLPIGNLSSQVFANYYLNSFDIWLSNKLLYGRYVDDFYLLGSKRDILKLIPEIRSNLSKYNITLHPRKWYLQHYSKGCKFLGGVSKQGRLYAGNTTVHNAAEAISEINVIKDKISNVSEVVQRLNSYLGYFNQFTTYAIRRNLVSKIDKEWFKYFYITGRAEKVVIRRKYRDTEKIRVKVIEQRNPSNKL